MKTTTITLNKKDVQKILKEYYKDDVIKKIEYSFKQLGDPDYGTYKEDLDEIIITLK